MKITTQYNSIYTPPVKKNNNIQFGAFKQPKLIRDIFIKQKSRITPYNKGIKRISGVRKGIFCGTICDNAIPMREFKSLFDKMGFEGIRKKGISTNTSGIPNCFLKAKSDIPISTSFVHDCSVMYLYNDETKTHALYHSAHDCPPSRFKTMLNTLMPEGITHGIIVPGDAYWLTRHCSTMENMLKVMKKNNPEAIVNVSNSASKYPEVVGYRGRTFEIPNIKIQKQINKYGHFIKDEGQASFQIMDLQGSNTLDRIKYLAKDLKDIEKLRHKFKMKGFNKEMLNILNIELDSKRSNIETIMNCKNIDELMELRELYIYENHYYEFS